MENVGTALATAIGYVGTVLTAITGNEVLVVLFAAGVIAPAAIGVFSRVKRAAR